MSNSGYLRQNFQSGQTLYAQELNDMDDGIVQANTDASNASTLANNASELANVTSAAVAAAQAKIAETENKVSTIDTEVKRISNVADSAVQKADTAQRMIDLLNVKNGTENYSLSQKVQNQTFSFDESVNENAVKVDPTLKSNINTGAHGTNAATFGGISAAIGNNSFATGYRTIVKAPNAFVEGEDSVVLGRGSHAEGGRNTIVGPFSHAEGYNTFVGANATGGHTEGFETQALGSYSHAQGERTVSVGIASFVSGGNLVTNYKYQTAFGVFNNNKAETIFEIGNGTGPTARERRNSFEVYQNGTVKVYKAPEANEDVVRNQELLSVSQQLEGVSKEVSTNKQSIVTLNVDISGYKQRLEAAEAKIIEVESGYGAALLKSKEEAIAEAKAYTDMRISWPPSEIESRLKF